MHDPNRLQAQFDANLPALVIHAAALARATPEAGWIRSLRLLLHMSSTALAQRLGIAHSGLLKIEKGELAGTVSLATLQRAAAALDADFVYAIVPRKSVRNTLHARSLELARDRLLHAPRSTHSSPDAAQLEHRIEELASQLESHPSQLWRLPQKPA